MDPRTAATKMTVVTRDGGFKVLYQKPLTGAKINLPAKRHKLMSFPHKVSDES
jgi:hypothetical protein